MSNGVAYLGRLHPLAGVAGRHCEAHLGNGRRAATGRVACGACWERAIRDDERVVVEHGLPRGCVPDPSFVDEIAVERAVRGEDVALTRLERTVVERLKRAAQRKGVEFAERGWLSPADARRGRRSPVDFKGRSRAPVTASADEDVAA